MNLFDPQRLSPWYWLADVAEPIQHPAYLAVAVGMFAGLVAALFVRVMADHMFDGHRLHQRLAARFANLGIGLFAAGLLVLLFRWQPVPFLSKRVWLLVWGLSALGAVAYGVYFYRRRYPLVLAAWQDSERRRRYLPRPGATARARRRPRRRR